MSDNQNIVVKFKVCVEEDDGGFHAYCPAFKGLHVGGDTVEEAVDNARLAAEMYLQSLFRHGDPLPIGDGFIIEREAVQVSASSADVSRMPPEPVLREVTTRVPCVA